MTLAACGGGVTVDPADLSSVSAPDLALASAPDLAQAPSADMSLRKDDLALAVGADLATAPDLSTPPAPKMWVMGYYAGYESQKYPVQAIGWNGLTHLAVAFYLPDKVGGLDESLFLDPVAGPKLGHALVDAAHKAGRKAIASVGGGGMHDQMAASTSNANRANFIKRILKLVSDYGYDGVDLDWEPIVNPTDVQPLLELAKGLKAGNPKLIVTLPLGTRNRNIPEDISYLGQYAAVFDQINLMSYGMAGAYQGWKSWHSAPLHWNNDASTPTAIDDSVDWVLKTGAPPSRIGVGSGFYGLCYSAPVTGPAQALGGATILANDGTMSYEHILAAYYSANAARWDAGALVPYLSFNAAHGPEKCTYVSYEDPRAIDEKGKYAHAKGLGGTIIWTINQGYIAGAPVGQQSPLLDAMETAFLK